MSAGKATKEEAKQKLLEVLPYIRFAVEDAKKKGNASIGILCEFPDGGGKIEARFTVDFLDDIAVLIDAPEQTAEDNMKAKAQQFLDQNGL